MANDPAGAVARAVAAVDHVVGLLDRGRAEPYRVSAFLKARPLLAGMDDAVLAAHVAAGTLTSIKGIGTSIAALVTDAVLGRESEYVSRIDRETVVRASPAAAPLRAALRGDLHTHTDWSDGGASITDMARAAAAVGHEYLAVTDHSGRLTVAKGLDRSRLARQLEELAALRARLADECGIRVLAGVEVDINEDGTLDADDDVLAELDIVVASVHARLSMPEEQMTPRLLRAVAHPHVDILGHCTGRQVVGRGRAESKADWDAVFATCARHGTAVEINCRPERLDPPRRLLRSALEHGCVFSIDSDAHAPGQLEWQPLGCDRAAEMEISAARVINTLPWAQLQAWTSTRAMPAAPAPV